MCDRCETCIHYAADVRPSADFDGFCTLQKVSVYKDLVACSKFVECTSTWVHHVGDIYECPKCGNLIHMRPGWEFCPVCGRGNGATQCVK